MAFAALTACGGGSGSPAPASSTGGASAASTSGTDISTFADGELRPLQFTASNAKASAANALSSFENSTVGATGFFVDGLKSAALTPRASPAFQMLRAGLAMARSALPDRAGLLLKSGSTVDELYDCPQGGTLRMVAQLTGSGSGSGFGPGDVIALTATSCHLDVDGAPSMLDGNLSLAIQNVDVTLGYPAEEVWMQVRELRVATAASVVVGTGDLRVVWSSESPTRQRNVFTSDRFTSTSMSGLRTRTLTWLDYHYTLERDGPVTTATLDARVQTRDDLLGPHTLTYAIATPMPLVHSVDGLSGEMRLTSETSAMRVRFTAPDTATLLLDEDGDGVDDKAPMNSSLQELRALTAN